jgi:NAD-dependent dihydropyrimidine dehydrogenase PreA subunit
MATRRVVLRFPQQITDDPIISTTVRDHNLDFNILRAEINAQGGLMVISFVGEDKSLDSALKALKKRGVKVEPIGRDVVRNEDKCTECGACVNICPTHALAIDLATRHVTFDADKCIACELCVPVCPSRAMELTF